MVSRLRLLFALAEEQLAPRSRRGLALLLREPLRAFRRRGRGIGRVRRNDGRRRRSLDRFRVLDLFRDVRELVEDHLQLALVELFERADLLLDPTQARGKILRHRMSPPRWVMIFGSPGRTFSAYSVSPRSISRRSASAAAGASARLVTMIRAPVWRASAASCSSGGTTSTSNVSGSSSSGKRRTRIRSPAFAMVRSKRWKIASHGVGSSACVYAHTMVLTSSGAAPSEV